MSGITTHVLDTARGRPAAGILATLEVKTDNGWIVLGRRTTNVDGRITNFFSAGESVDPGVYRLTFETGAYLAGTNSTGFYPYIPIVFEISAPEQHHHIPLLLSPFGYSTYRGS